MPLAPRMAILHGTSPGRSQRQTPRYDANVILMHSAYTGLPHYLAAGVVLRVGMCRHRSKCEESVMVSTHMSIPSMNCNGGTGRTEVVGGTRASSPPRDRSERRRERATLDQRR